MIWAYSLKPREMYRCKIECSRSCIKGNSAAKLRCFEICLVASVNTQYATSDVNERVGPFTSMLSSRYLNMHTDTHVYLLERGVHA